MRHDNFEKMLSFLNCTHTTHHGNHGHALQKIAVSLIAVVGYY